MATFSTSERKRRPRGDRKSIEMTMHLKQTFDAAIMTQLYPRSQIDIFVEVSFVYIFMNGVLWDRHAFALSHLQHDTRFELIITGICPQVSKYSRALIIRTKIRENFVRIKQNVSIIHASKSMESMGKHAVVKQ